MALYVEDPAVDRLAHEVARMEGTSVTEAIASALAERRAKLLAAQDEKRRRVEARLSRIKALPIQDTRHPDEMLYDESGHPQ